MSKALVATILSMRGFAIAELADLKDEKAAPALVSAVLNDPVFENRNAAFKGVKDIAPATAVRLFTDALNSESARTRFASGS